MIHRSIPLPHKHVYRKTPQKDRNSVQLKEYLVFPGIRALAHRDMARVGLIAHLLAGRRLRHV
jgi:hypothetical protein